MERQSVESSNILSVGYKEDTQTLEVEFKGGTVYQYSDVPKTEYENLINAVSVGSYFHQNIKNNFSFNKI